MPLAPFPYERDDPSLTRRVATVVVLLTPGTDGGGGRCGRGLSNAFKAAAIGRGGQALRDAVRGLRAAVAHRCVDFDYHPRVDEDAASGGASFRVKLFTSLAPGAGAAAVEEEQRLFMAAVLEHFTGVATRLGCELELVPSAWSEYVHVRPADRTDA